MFSFTAVGVRMHIQPTLVLVKKVDILVSIFDPFSKPIEPCEFMQ